MTITVVFDPPLPSDSPATFNTKAFSTLGDLNDWSTEANALAVEINSGVPIAVATHAATSKTTPVDADEIPMSDSAASWGLKKLTWANIKATAKTYFDTLYQAVGTYVTPTTLNNGTLPASVTTLAASGNVTLGNATTDTVNIGAGGIVKDASGNTSFGGSALVTSATGGLGYGAGAGGTVDQYAYNGSVSQAKNQGVTLNKPSGRISTGNASLAAGATVYFTLSNSLITSIDSVLVTFSVSGGDAYNVWVANVYTGNAVFVIKNISASSLAQVITITFVVIKGATS